ncbi:MAG: PAS domain S-box protein [bacterium]
MEKRQPTGQISRVDDAVEEIIQYIRENFASMYDLHNEVAEQNEMNENLRIKLNQLQQLFENANTAIFIYSIDGFIIEVNRKACEMLGYLREELIKFSFYQLQTEYALHQSTEAQKTNDDSLSIRYESVFKHKSGRTFPVEISTSAIDLDAGIMQSMVNDISQRIKMETALKDSEDRFRTFMETASDLMFITDSNGQFIYVNQAIVDSLGYPKDVLLELGIQDIVQNNGEKEIQDIFDSWLSDEKQKEIMLKTRKRTVLWGEIQTVGIYTEQKEFQGVRGIVRDITERKKIEESQRLSQLGKLAADVAHGIKNQLTAVIYLAEMAVMEESDINNIKEPVQQILDQCWEINNIVKRLLNFSTPSAGDFQPVNIHSIIDFVVGLVEKQYSKNGVRINREYDSSLPHLTVDDKQMREVFMNLIQNAYESIKNEGKIEIKTMELGEFVQIDFIDTGGGIKGEEMKQIFDPFFTTKKDGTGLGVSACYGILKAHGGNLQYSSTEGEGTTATVLLPILPPKSIKNNKK